MITVDAAYVRRSLRDPRAELVERYPDRMPLFAFLPESEVASLVLYSSPGRSPDVSATSVRSETSQAASAAEPTSARCASAAHSNEAFGAESTPRPEQR